MKKNIGTWPTDQEGVGDIVRKLTIKMKTFPAICSFEKLLREYFGTTILVSWNPPKKCLTRQLFQEVDIIFLILVLKDLLTLLPP